MLFMRVLDGKERKTKDERRKTVEVLDYSRIIMSWLGRMHRENDKGFSAIPGPDRQFIAFLIGDPWVFPIQY